jgi:diguanylate cyclase (GGDEF)-like protein
MPFTLDVLLAILLATLVANTLVMVLLVRRARSRSAALAASALASAEATRQALSASAAPRLAAWPARGPDAGADAPSERAGLIDATAFHELLAREDGRIQRYHRPATIAVFELDGLARLTERLGPEAGDRVVAAMADTVRRLAREADQVAALGTGRFAVLLPETDEITSINYIERVRRASELWLESSAIAVRLAVGWAGTSGDPSLLDTHQVALDRMYAESRRHARSAAAMAGVDVDLPVGQSTEPAVAS